MVISSRFTSLSFLIHGHDLIHVMIVTFCESGTRDGYGKNDECLEDEDEHLAPTHI